MRSPVSYCIRVIGATMMPAIAPRKPLMAKAIRLMVRVSIPTIREANGFTAQARKALPI